jgi:uncharacterized SAM-binding protein YcdF (DUF218 family)
LTLCAGGFIFAEPILHAYGGLLVEAGPPRKAGAILVLAGGWRGERILTAGELVRAGYAPIVLMSDPDMRYYGVSECRLAIEFAASRGFPPASFVCVTTAGDSTREESAAMVAEVRRRGVRDFLLVSSEYHTRRATYLYRWRAPDLRFSAVAARSPSFALDRWWTTRDGRKHVLLESMKYVADRLGL